MTTRAETWSVCEAFAKRSNGVCCPSALYLSLMDRKIRPALLTVVHRLFGSVECGPSYIIQSSVDDKVSRTGRDDEPEEDKVVQWNFCEQRGSKQASKGKGWEIW